MTQCTKTAMLLFVAALCGPFGLAQNKNAPKTTLNSGRGFDDFSANVQRYVKLHRRAEKSLPKLKKSASSASIATNQHALARRIEHLRSHAHQGEIFTPVAVRAFHDAIEQEFRSSEAKNARATITEGAPVKNVHLRANEPYPAGLPYTSVPPTLLLRFPKLPSEVEYRIVDHELVLLDVKAEFVVDVMPRALP